MTEDRGEGRKREGVSSTSERRGGECVWILMVLWTGNEEKESAYSRG